jgi:hypothetical protein
MAHPKPISKEQCIAAMKHTRSVRAAARYLNCSYQHLKPFMKAYKDEETGLSLFDLHKNQSGKGIPKFITHNNFDQIAPIEDIMNGVIDASSFNTDKIKFKMIEAGFLLEQCYYCGFEERRDIDGKTPLLMTFLNNHKHDYTNGNAQLCCYNCYFLNIGNVFTDKDIESIEGHAVYNTTNAVDFQVDEYTAKRLAELGGFDAKVTDNPYDLVSRKK